MSEAPERIWAFHVRASGIELGEWVEDPSDTASGTEYVRADRIEALEREVAEAERANRAMAQSGLYLANSWQSRAEAAEAERDEARISLGEAEHHLSNLLARIHRDGGHYEADHGAVKAAEDADKIVANLYAAEADKARLSEALRPFAKAADVIDSKLSDDVLLFAHFPSLFGGQTEIRLGDLRKARAALSDEVTR